MLLFKKSSSVVWELVSELLWMFPALSLSVSPLLMLRKKTDEIEANEKTGSKNWMLLCCYIFQNRSARAVCQTFSVGFSIKYIIKCNDWYFFVPLQPYKILKMLESEHIQRHWSTCLLTGRLDCLIFEPIKFAKFPAFPNCISFFFFFRATIFAFNKYNANL